MSRFTYAIMTVPKPGREQEWDDWHREHLVPAVLRIPGFVGADRFRAAKGAGEGQPCFMTLYGIDTDDIGGALAELKRRQIAGDLPATDASDPSKTINWLWEATTRHVSAD